MRFHGIAAVCMMVIDRNEDSTTGAGDVAARRSRDVLKWSWRACDHGGCDSTHILQPNGKEAGSSWQTTRLGVPNSKQQAHEG